MAFACSIASAIMGTCALCLAEEALGTSIYGPLMEQRYMQAPVTKQLTCIQKASALLLERRGGVSSLA